MVRPRAVLDVDGVLADARHRLPLLHAAGRAGRPDWEAFFSLADRDPALPEGLAAAAHLARDHEVVYLSGRPERLRAVTETWLADHGLPEGPLLLRREGDRRPARVVKREAVRRLAREGPVAVVVDDDPAVAESLAADGVPVLLADWASPQQDPALHAAQEGGAT